MTADDDISEVGRLAYQPWIGVDAKQRALDRVKKQLKPTERSKVMRWCPVPTIDRSLPLVDEDDLFDRREL